MSSSKSAFNGRVIPSDAVESFWEAADGWPIRRIDWKAKGAARGALLFLVGRGDHYEKYLETLDHFAGLGWNVTAIDWRGQGNSGRLLPDRHIGHIEDFSIWIADLGHFWKHWKTENAGPHVLLTHSMGGHLGMRALSEGVIDPVAVSMSAPMLSIQSGGMPLSVSHIVARFMCSIGSPERAAWKESEKPMSPMALRRKILTHDVTRYEDELAWWELRPEVRLGPPSWRWVERSIVSIQLLSEPGAMERIKTPILLMATSADQLVSTPRIIADSKRLPHATLLLFGKEAAHELLREVDEVRDQCLSATTAFWDEHAPRSDA